MDKGLVKVKGLKGFQKGHPQYTVDYMKNLTMKGKGFKKGHPQYWHRTQDFWANVEKTPTCWIWKGTVHLGYGEISYKGKVWKAHRVAWVLTNHDLPEGSLLRHLCDRSLCVNPAHLRIGTKLENSLDFAQYPRDRQLCQQALLRSGLYEMEDLELHGTAP